MVLYLLIFQIYMSARRKRCLFHSSTRLSAVWAGRPCHDRSRPDPGLRAQPKMRMTSRIWVMRMPIRVMK